MADLSECESSLFLLDDPERFQREYHGPAGLLDGKGRPVPQGVRGVVERVDGRGCIMKKRISLLLAALCLCLAGCAALPPERAADGSDWGKGWVTMGGVLGVDTPEGLTPRENNEALSANGMFYATWSMGEGEDYANEDGEDAVLYDAQFYILLADASSAEEAEAAADGWLELADGRYRVDGRFEETYNGQPFTVLAYTYGSDTNPYQRGASAYGVYRNFAVSVELSCRADFPGDAPELLGEFLEHCHYGA